MGTTPYNFADDDLTFKRRIRTYIQRIFELAYLLLLMPQLRKRSVRAPEEGPLVVTGYADVPFGLGEACRANMRLLQELGYSLVGIPARDILGGLAEPLLAEQPPGGIWYIHCNAPEAIFVLRKSGRFATQSRYLIGYWAWELPKMPWLWRQAAPLFDEIWVPSQFVADSLEGAARKIRIVPHPIGVEAQSVSPPGPPVILCAGDYRSSLQRKNVLGAVRIFTESFPEPGTAQLIIKLQNLPAMSEAGEALRRLTAGRPDISLVTETLTQEGIDRLIQSASIFLSPHRSEGFGLMIALFLASGKGVLVTDWSGNTDFTNGLDPFLIPCELVSVQDPSGIYKSASGQVWAEPDIGAAAAKLRWMVENPAAVAEWARRGRERILELNDVARQEVADALSTASHISGAAGD